MLQVAWNGFRLEMQQKENLSTWLSLVQSDWFVLQVEMFLHTESHTTERPCCHHRHSLEQMYTPLPSMAWRSLLGSHGCLLVYKPVSLDQGRNNCHKPMAWWIFTKLLRHVNSSQINKQKMPVSERPVLEQVSAWSGCQLGFLGPIWEYLLHSQFGLHTNVLPGKRQVIVSALGSLPPIWNSRMSSWLLSGLERSRRCRHAESEWAVWDLCGTSSLVEPEGSTEDC